MEQPQFAQRVINRPYQTCAATRPETYANAISRQLSQMVRFHQCGVGDDNTNVTDFLMDSGFSALESQRQERSVASRPVRLPAFFEDISKQPRHCSMSPNGLRLRPSSKRMMMRSGSAGSHETRSMNAYRSSIISRMRRLTTCCFLLERADGTATVRSTSDKQALSNLRRDPARNLR